MYDRRENWTLAEKKDLQSKQAELEEAERVLQSKLGSDWKLDVDFASFGEHTPKSEGYRATAGKWLVTEKVGKCVAKDIGTMEGRSDGERKKKFNPHRVPN